MWRLAAATLHLVSAEGLRSASAVSRFGPNNCVSVQRSAAGTCVLATNCPAQTDIENFEFAFICVTADHRLQKHSFGVGGFDLVEAFDTQVPCASCRAPTASDGAVSLKGDGATQAPAAAPASAPAQTTATPVPTVAPVNAEKGKPAEASFYGPAHCVSTYRSPAGTCVMQTRCEDADIHNYNFGLTCVDAKGESTRHLFGKNSFDPRETFDTLIDCQLCLGLDNKAAQPASTTVPPSDGSAKLVGGGTKVISSSSDARVSRLETEVATLESRVATLEKLVPASPAAALRHGHSLHEDHTDVAGIESVDTSVDVSDDGGDDDWGY
mmetsp:Transcript_10682/g.25413  ORF Transcript_10682/g.25413 Transcript_10682/m.25413 type:complete len:325 (-) Transcript_10682:24-998(-)